jgi:hypothetical protein
MEKIKELVKKNFANETFKNINNFILKDVLIKKYEDNLIYSTGERPIIQSETPVYIFKIQYCVFLSIYFGILRRKGFKI